jgi:hypothetical protein
MNADQSTQYLPLSFKTNRDIPYCISYINYIRICEKYFKDNNTSIEDIIAYYQDEGLIRNDKDDVFFLER